MTTFDTSHGALIAPNGFRFTQDLALDSVVRAGFMFIREISMRTGWTYKTTSAFTVSGHTVYFALGFKEERLRQIQFAFTDLRDESAPKRRLAHDVFLAAELGPPAMKNEAFTGYDFPWGKITSAFDPRTNGTDITLSWT